MIGETKKKTLKLAIRLIGRYAAQWEEYQEECADYRRKGFAPRHCEHGMNLWVDHDVICHGCEEGYSNGNPLQRRQKALQEAKRRMSDVDELTTIFEVAGKYGVHSAINADVICRKIRVMLALPVVD